MKTPCLSIILLLFFSSMGVSVCAQKEKLRFEHYSLGNERSHNYVRHLLQDRKGYLWFSINDGLMKYDGYDFINYKHSPQDTGSLIQNVIFSLWEDSDGMIWIGTTESGISKFDRKTGQFTHYQPPGDSTSLVHPLRSVSAINEDNEGYLWVGTYLGELRRFNKQTGTFFPEKYDLGYEQMSDTLNTHNNIYCIFKDRSGTLWIGDDGGLHKLNITSGKGNGPSIINFEHYLADTNNPDSSKYNSVSSIFEDHQGLLWIGISGWGSHGRGLISLNTTSGVFTTYLHDPRNSNSISSNAVFMQSIVEDTAGNLWIGTFNGLNKLNKDRTRFTRYLNDPNDPESLGANLVTSLLIDSSGILWVGNMGNGLDRLDPHQKPFSIYRHDPFNDLSLSSDTINNITGDNSGIIWVDTDVGSLNALNKNKGEFTRYQYDYKKLGNLGNNSIRFVPDAKTSDGDIWILGTTGFTLFNTKRRKFIPDSLHSGSLRILNNDVENFTRIYEDRQKMIWIGTGDNGLKMFDPRTGKIVHYRHNAKNLQGLGDHAILAILEDNRGFLWVGHGSVGLSRLDKRTGIFDHFLPDQHDSTRLSTSVVISIYEDSKKNLWFGTLGGGLCLFNYETESFTTFSEKHGLAANTITSIQEDTEGNLWLGTTNGISRFSPGTGVFTNYNTGDGLPATINSAASYIDKDGILYYGSNEGLVSFDPRLIKPNTYIPPVVITQFRLYDKPIPGKNESEEIVLNHDENFFSFEFSALNYTNASNNQYKYQLVGVDKEWVSSGTRRLASYTNISPGEYVFRVIASNNDGIWNKEGISVRIIIQPPWWRTWIAYAFYGLCFLFLLFLVDRIQRRRVIDRERERSRQREVEQAREIEKAYNKLKVTQKQLIQSEKMASLGELTAGIAHEIQNPLNFINNFSEVNKELIDEMENELNANNRNEAISIAKDIKENEEKINHHGKRADAIVKSMLQHSHNGTGIKEPTAINTLADEYFRLAYHACLAGRQGLRAKDSTFNVTLKTDFDESIGKINVNPQDIGRVLLNIFNNAFYTVNEKKKLQLSGYEPVVLLRTKKKDDKIEIRIKDNGDGISQKIVDKIFQPFFTTKSTGVGTGLGLSLAYDIIKAHDGELSVETKEGEGAEFIIHLPAV